MIQNQIEQFASNFAYKSGDIVKDCSIRDIPLMPYLRLDDFQANGSSYDAFALVNTQVISASSNLAARVVIANTGLASNYPNTNVVYVTYGNVGDAVGANGELRFTNNDTFTFRKLPLTGNDSIDIIAVINAYSNATAYTDNKAANAYSNAIAYSGNAAQAYANATTFASNATNISSGTIDTARLPATANISTAINVGANVNLSTSQINIGNATVNTVITSTSITGNGANITSVNAATVGGNTASDLRTYTDNKAANAYSNAIAYSGNAAQAYSNATSYADTKAATAYSNAIAYSGNAAQAYSNATSYADTKAATAYSNATAFASNASNISSGTLSEPRLPYRMDQNVRSTDNVQFNAVTVNNNVLVGSVNITNATINVNSIQINTSAIAIGTNFTANSTAVFSNGNITAQGSRAISLLACFSIKVWRLSCAFFPRASASSTFTFPLAK